MVIFVRSDRDEVQRLGVNLEERFARIAMKVSECAASISKNASGFKGLGARPCY